MSVMINSIHRNTMDTINNLNKLDRWKEYATDVLIAGAGMANHLTGTADAYLRHYLRNDRIKVIGVAFRGKTDEDTMAAILSIEKVPCTQVIFNREFVGSEGFLKACKLAVEGDIPEIKIPERKQSSIMSIEYALKEIEIINKKETEVK